MLRLEVDYMAHGGMKMSIKMNNKRNVSGENYDFVKIRANHFKKIV